MDQPRASRLSKSPAASQKDALLGEYFPVGTWKRFLVLWVGIPIVVLLILGLVTDKVVMPILTRQGTEFTLPDFTGQRLAETEVQLHEHNLGYAIASEEYSPSVSPGVILSQYPIAGTKVKPDREIKFVVSLGQKAVTVPDVSGQSVRQAMLTLESSGLELGEIAWAFSDTIPEKVVVFSYPAKGLEIPLGSQVNLMVNRGRASDFTYMPGVVGLPLSEAKKRIEDKSLKVGLVSPRTDENFLPETVLEQSEPEGTELDVGTEIDLVVSSTE